MDAVRQRNENEVRRFHFEYKDEFKRLKVSVQTNKKEMRKVSAQLSSRMKIIIHKKVSDFQVKFMEKSSSYSDNIS